jgi:hypothetical protein
MAINIRKPAVADAFYPGEPDDLKKMIDGFLKDAKAVKVTGKLRALIVPHAGYVYSGPIAAFGYKLLAKEKNISKVLLIGPSHYAGFFGAAESGADAWQTPLGIVKCGKLGIRSELISSIPEAHAPEHNLEVQIPFLQTAMQNKNFIIYPILTGEVSPESLANALLDFIDDKTLIIASSDLSHYLPYDVAKEKDAVTINAIKTQNIKTLDTKGDACGITAILTLLFIAKSKAWKCKLLDYRNSGDTAGSKEGVVGYSAFIFYEG